MNWFNWSKPKAIKEISTPEDWATGFAIKIEQDDGSIWRLDGTRVSPIALFQEKDRKQMKSLRDRIIKEINRKL